MKSHLPALHEAFVDILYLHELEHRESAPFPGYSVLVVITSWKCFYLAFANDEVREAILNAANQQIETGGGRFAYGQFCTRTGVTSFSNDQHTDYTEEDKPLDSWKARFWLGFRDSMLSLESEGKRKVRHGPRST